MKRFTVSLAATGLALVLTACGKSQAEGPSPSAAPVTPASPSGAATAESAELGKPAPDFALQDTDGKTHKLSDYKGKTVVLEWYNPDCPFVVKQHNEGPLKTMAKDVTGNGVVWLAINSGAAGKQGAGLERNKSSLTEYGLTHPILLDADGKVGKAYKARNTPHMYVVTPDGTLAYMGAIDNAPMGKVPESGLVNHVADALADLAANRPVKVPETKAYGCSVKYAD